MSQIFRSIEELAQWFVNINVTPIYKYMAKCSMAKGKCDSCSRFSRYWIILYSALICRACVHKAHKTTIWKQRYGRVKREITESS